MYIDTLIINTLTMKNISNVDVSFIICKITFLVRCVQPDTILLMRVCAAFFLRRKREGNLKVLCWGQMLFKSLSVAIIYSILGRFAEHRCSCADLKLSFLLKGMFTIDADKKGRRKKGTLAHISLLVWKYSCALDRAFTKFFSLC